uniref:Uncharacterized protein n=1 Tax=Capitella teleta TaxID=283909 RepID=X1ZNY6_CAPTE
MNELLGIGRTHRECQQSKIVHVYRGVNIALWIPSAYPYAYHEVASIQKLSVWRVFDKRQRAECAISLLRVAHQSFPANSSLRFAPSAQRAESQQPIRDECALLRHVLSEFQSSKSLGIARILFGETNRPISEDTRYVCSTTLLIYYKVGFLSRIGGITLRKKVEGVLNRLMHEHTTHVPNELCGQKEGEGRLPTKSAVSDSDW